MCKDSNNNEYSIPIEYTSMRERATPVSASETESDFEYDALIELLELLGNIIVK